MATIYVPPQDRQGTSTNCGPSTFAMAASRDWLGVKIGSESAIRTWVTNNRTPDRVGTGISMADGIAAVKALYDTDMLYRYAFPFTDLAPMLNVTALYDTNENHGRGAVVCIKYSVLHGTSFDHAPGFNGRHYVLANQRRYNTTKRIYEYQVLDPTASAPAWWPERLLRSGMELAGTEASYTRSITSPTKKVLCSGAYLESAAKVTPEPEGAIARGTYIFVLPPVAGESYSTSCAGYAASNLWYEVTKIETGDAFPPTFANDEVYWTPVTGHSFIKKTRVTF